MGTQALRRDAKQMAVAFPHHTSRSLRSMGVDIRIPIADDFDGIEWWWTMIDDDCSDYCCETAGEQGVSVTNEEGRWITTVTTEVSRLIYGEEQLRRVVFLLFFFFFFFFHYVFV